MILTEKHKARIESAIRHAEASDRARQDDTVYMVMDWCRYARQMIEKGEVAEDEYLNCVRPLENLK